jgi:Ca2+-binding RTX toxin-like protein
MTFSSWLHTVLSHRAPRRRRLHAALTVERLEDRVTPSVNWSIVTAGLKPSLDQMQTDLNNIDQTAVANKVNNIPVINAHLSAIPQVNGLISSFEPALLGALQGNDDTTVTNNIFTELGPMGLKFLATTHDVSVIGEADVTVTLTLHKDPSVGPADRMDFGLGLPSVPLTIRHEPSPMTPDVEVRTGLTYTLVFGLQNGKFFLANSPAGFDVSVDATIPNATSVTPMKGAIGFIPIDAADNPDAKTKFHGDFKMDVTGVPVPSMPNATAHLVNATLSGGAMVNLMLTTDPSLALPGSLSSPALPQLTSNFIMSWNFNTSGLNGAANTFGDPPTVNFSNNTLDVGPLLSNFAQPVVQELQKIAQTLAPVLDALQQPLPIVGESLQGFLADAGFIDSNIASIINFATDIDTLANNVQGVLAGLGGISVPLPPSGFGLGMNDDLRTQPAAGDLMNFGNALTQLQPENPTALKYQDIESAIVSHCPSNIQTAMQTVLDFFDPTKNTHITLSFPLLTDLVKGLDRLLLGQDVDIIRFTAGFNDTVNPSLTVPAPAGAAGAVFSFGGTISIDAAIGIAYDTHGLRELAHDTIYNSPVLADLADGLYVDTPSHVIVQGSLGVSVVGFGPFALVVANGSVDANISLKTVDTAVDSAVDGPDETLVGKRRLFQDADNDVGEFLFATSGGISGEVSGTAGAQVFTPAGPVIIIASYDTGPITLLDLSGGGIANPFAKKDTVMLAGPAVPLSQNSVGDFIVQGANGVLTLNLGSKALRDARGISQGDKGEAFSVTPATARTGDPAGEAVWVSAYGIKQRYAGVTMIVATETGMVTPAEKDGFADVTIGEGITVPAILTGGPNKDVLTYQGSGDSTVKGGGGDDILTGGAGTNHITAGDGNVRLVGGGGTNFLTGGTGDDTFLGGKTGINQMVGGAGDDTFFAGDNNDVIQGGTGNETVTAGGGRDIIYGATGDNTINWSVGDGNIMVYGDGDTTFDAFGSDAADMITLSHDNAGVTMQAGTANVSLSNVQTINLESADGADNITVNDLSHTSVQGVNINLSEVAKPDHSHDVVVVNGTTGADHFKIQAQNATDNTGVVLGEVTDVQHDDSYLVQVANAHDNLIVNGQGGTDRFDIHSISGATRINGGAGNDTFNVTAQKTTDYVGTLTIDGMSGSNALTVDESGYAAGDTVSLTSSKILSNLFPSGVQFGASGGTFGQGIVLMTGGGDDTVNVQSTLTGATTSVNTGGGADTINVSSDAPMDQGNLTGLAGKLAIDAGTGMNQLHVSDVGGTPGNLQVQIDAGHIAGLAGLTGNTDIAYVATGGTFAGIEVDSAAMGATLESFLVNNPNGPLTLDANGGPDKVVVQALAYPATINTGAANDEIDVQVASNSAYHLTVDGGPFSTSPPGNVLKITDVSNRAVMHDHVLNEVAGEVDVFYLQGAASVISYMNFQQVLPSVDAVTSFVKALYHTVVKREPLAGELSTGVALASMSGGPTQLATQLEHSDEARRLLLSSWFKTYFNIAISPHSPGLVPALTYLHKHTEEQTLAMLFGMLLAPGKVKIPQGLTVAEFVYKDLLGRLPFATEQTTGSATQLALSILKGNAYRYRAVKGYFLSILRRTQPPMSSDVNTLLQTGDGLTAIRIMMEGSMEFFDNGY